MKLWPWGRRKSNTNRMLAIVGGVVAAAVVTGVVITFPDIRRYIRISTM